MKYLFPFLLIAVFTDRVVSQNDFARMDSAYWEQVGRMNRQYESDIARMDSLFYLYLEQPWEAFPVHKGIQDRIYQRKEIMVEPVSLPPAGEDFYPKARKATEYLKVSFLFFETRVQFDVDPTSRIQLSSPSEKLVTAGLKLLQSTDFPVILKQANRLRQLLSLNDWGYLCLLEQLSWNLFSSDRKDEQVCFMAFLLNKSGYDVKLCRSSSRFLNRGGKLHLMLPFRTQVFQQDFVEINQKDYYIHKYQVEKDVQIHTYRLNHFYAKNKVDLSISTPPRFSGSTEEKIITFSSNPVRQVKFHWKKGLVSFYNQYPETELSIYFRAGISPELEQSLLNSFDFLKNEKDNIRLNDRLLQWFHKQFPYKEDEKQFGTEKKFFPEQCLYFPFSDCEDRAVFFAHMIRILTGLDIGLFVYSNHVASGICFDLDLKGYSKTFQGKKYTICDPTFLNASPGSVMPAYKSAEPDIIPFNKD